MQGIQLKKVRTQGKIDNGMTKHMKVLVTLGKARENKKQKKNQKTWALHDMGNKFLFGENYYW